MTAGSLKTHVRRVLGKGSDTRACPKALVRLPRGELVCPKQGYFRVRRLMVVKKPQISPCEDPAKPLRALSCSPCEGL